MKSLYIVCKKENTPGKSGCVTPDGREMTRGEESAARKACKKKGTVVSRTFVTRWYWNKNTCQCEKKESSGRETVEKTGDVIKDAFQCMKDGFMYKNGKKTNVTCDANKPLSKIHSVMNPK
jgi:hypothetical protein